MINSLKTYHMKLWGQDVQVDVCSDGKTYFIDSDTGEAIHERETVEADLEHEESN